jgi:hypothetical protein
LRRRCVASVCRTVSLTLRCACIFAQYFRAQCPRLDCLYFRILLSEFSFVIDTIFRRHNLSRPNPRLCSPQFSLEACQDLAALEQRLSRLHALDAMFRAAAAKTAASASSASSSSSSSSSGSTSSSSYSSSSGSTSSSSFLSSLSSSSSGSVLARAAEVPHLRLVRALLADDHVVLETRAERELVMAVRCAHISSWILFVRLFLRGCFFIALIPSSFTTRLTYTSL